MIIIASANPDFYGVDGLLRTRDVFGWSLERSNEWLSAHVSAAVLRAARSAERGV
jgi:hypothetical protein